MSAQELSPINPSNRNALIDILRGWALFIVVLMNILPFYWHNKPENFNISEFSTTWWMVRIQFELFSTKGWTLLGVLFGYGFAQLLYSTEAKGINSYRYFLWRMLLLFIIGLINSAFYGGDILLDYAVVGALLLFFFKLKTKYLWAISIILLLCVPFLDPYFSQHKWNVEWLTALQEKYTKAGELGAKFLLNYIERLQTMIFALNYSVTVHLVQLACFLLGILAFRFEFFNTLSTVFKPLLKRVFWISGSLFIVVLTIDSLVRYVFENEAVFKVVSLRYVKAIPGMLLFASGFCLLYIRWPELRLLQALKVVGRMTLTNYLVQNIITFILFIQFKIDMEIYGYTLLALMIFVGQAFFSKWWLSQFNYGPVEWIWRCASYRKKFPLRKENLLV